MFPLFSQDLDATPATPEQIATTNGVLAVTDAAIGINLGQTRS